MPSPPARWRSPWPRALGLGLSVLSVYDYGEIKAPSVSAEMAARYREDMMQRMDGAMETKMKAFLAGVQAMDNAIAPIVQAGEPRKTILEVAERLPADLLVIGAHNKRSVLDVVLGGTAGHVSRHATCPRDHGDAKEKSLDTRHGIGEGLRVRSFSEAIGPSGGRVCALKRRYNRGKGDHPTATRT